MNSSNATSLIQVSIDSEGIALIKLNRPEKRNALSQQLIDALVSAIARVDCDEKVRVIVLTGSNPAGPFSAGADLSELRHHTTSSAHAIQYLAQVSSSLGAARKPILASVAGFALGGGFELALACDIIFCSPTAKFGLPELSVGTIPGAGGTQRLTRLVGRQRAMWLVLSGEVVSGQVMGEWGVVQCVEGDVLKETMRVAKKIASWSGPVVQLAKEAVRNAEETHLEAGLKLERGLYYSSFSLSDSKEGMTAFIEKRNPVFKDQ